MEKDKAEPEELKITGETPKELEGGEMLTPNLARDFESLMVDYGVDGKAAHTIIRHILDTGSDAVFSTPMELLGKMTKFPRQVPPVTRKQILDHWIALNKLPVPEEYEEIAAKHTKEISTMKEKEEAEQRAREEKYSVDTDSGSIKVASKEDKTALTWEEADKLSTKIKKELEQKKKEEAKIEKEQKEEAKLEQEGQEPPFVLNEQGTYVINPKAKLRGMDYIVWDVLRDKQARGEKPSLFQVMEETAKSIEAIRSITGTAGGGAGAVSTIDELIKLKSLIGADDDTKKLLGGIFSKISDLTEGKGQSEEVKSLRDDISKLRAELEKKDRETLNQQIKNLETQIGNMRTDIQKAGDQARAKDEYGIMSEALRVADHRLGAIESTVQGVFGRRPPPMPAAQRKELTEAISEVAQDEQVIDALAEQVFRKQP